MTVQQLIDTKQFQIVNETGDTERKITTAFCCDLLSIAMGKAPAGAAWVTVMGNVNTIAIASLTETAVVILAEGIELDGFALQKAKEKQVIVLSTKMPIFEAALWIYGRLYR